MRGHISVEVEFVVCFPSEFKHWYVHCERNDREPNSEVYKILVCVTFSAFFFLLGETISDTFHLAMII